jgi:hypothetical protein
VTFDRPEQDGAALAISWVRTFQAEGKTKAGFSEGYEPACLEIRRKLLYLGRRRSRWLGAARVPIKEGLGIVAK